VTLLPSELEAAGDRLYPLPIGEFTDARNALAAAQKAEGEKDAAARGAAEAAHGALERSSSAQEEENR